MDVSVLVLNASYEAINICDVKRAIKMLVKGIACAEKEYEREIHSASASFKIPSVIRLFRYVHIPHRTVKFSRKNVLFRDRYTCQYCNKLFPSAFLTLDHVEPISRGGTTSWDNVVTACKKCNTKKANRTPMEARMQTIRNEYKAPHVIHFLHASKSSTSYYQEWQEFLFAR